MDFDEAVDHLESLINHEARPRAGRVAGLSLEPMRRLAAAMGDPQTAYPVVHVTGTNGKGSTVRMTAALLQAMGLRVGAYTSPHLVEVTERVCVGSAPIGAEDFGAAVGAVAGFAGHLGMKATWFETVTAAALRHFADEAVDAAVVEVGMLGRFDATNVVDGLVAAVTNVGFDHTDGAGDWRRRIAGEKAGIIKAGSTVVLGETDPDLGEVFAAEPSGAVVVRDRDFGVSADRLAVGGRLLDLHTPRGRYDSVMLSLHGRHQADNAAVALAAAESFFGAALPDGVVAEALAGVRVPGRFEIAGRHPLVVLDGAHNPDGARAAAATLAEDFAPAGRRFVVVGMQDGRDPRAVLEALDAVGAELVVACTAPTARGIPAAEVAAAARSLGADCEAVADVGAAIDRARSLAAETDVISVVGSFTVVGAAKEALGCR